MHRHLASQPKSSSTDTLKETRLRGKRGTQSDPRPSHSPSLVIKKQVESRRADGIDMSEREATRSGNAVAAGRNAVGTRVTKGSSVKNYSNPKRGATDSLLKMERKREQQEQNWSQSEAAEDRTHLANTSSRETDHSSGGDDSSGNRNKTQATNSQTAHVAISRERCEDAHHPHTFKLQEIAESKWRNTFVNSISRPRKNMKKDSPELRSSLAHTSTTRVHPHYLDHNIPTHPVNQTQSKTREQDGKSFKGTGTVHSSLGRKTELIGYGSSPSTSYQRLRLLVPRDSRPGHGKTLFRRSVETETLKSTDHRISEDESSLRSESQKDKDEDEEEDEEDEDEVKAWEKACGSEGEGEGDGPAGRRLGGGSLHSLGSSRVHVAETVVTLRLKDVNDNSPVFPNATMFGQVQENGPIGEY